MMDPGTVVKVCVIITVVVVTVVVSLLAVILYEVQNQQEPSSCSEDVNSRLSQQDAQQAMHILSVCEAACSVLSMTPSEGDPVQNSDCVTCCQLTNDTRCRSQENEELTCSWRLIGSGGLCVKSSFVNFNDGPEREV